MKRTALSIVQKHFPQVSKVIDGKQNLEIEVLSKDANAQRLDHEQCAIAKACKRAYQADGVIVSRTMCYMIKGDLAVRFMLPASITREIVAFDRGAQFVPGIYHLVSPIGKSANIERRKQLNAARKRKSSKEEQTGKQAKKRHFHLTQGIRSVLGGIEDKG
jgi:hypothetical protein